MSFYALSVGNARAALCLLYGAGRAVVRLRGCCAVTEDLRHGSRIQFSLWPHRKVDLCHLVDYTSFTSRGFKKVCRYSTSSVRLCTHTLVFRCLTSVRKFLTVMRQETFRSTACALCSWVEPCTKSSWRLLRRDQTSRNGFVCRCVLRTNALSVKTPVPLYRALSTAPHLRI